MKHDWEYKKLGDTCVLTMGQSPSSDTYNTDGDGLPFFQGCSDFGRIHPTITTFCTSPTKVAQAQDVLMSVRAPIGTLNIANAECCIGRGLASFRAADDGDSVYLYYVLLHSKAKLQSLGTGSTFKAIGKDSLKNYVIPYPPLSVQEQIASELDKVSEVIEKKKQQVKELDTLAQSLFYEMFGDPITNNKGWNTYTLKDSCKRLYAGGDVPKEQFSREPTSIYSIPIFSNGVEQEGLYGYTSISKENEPCITIAGRGTIGYCVKRTKPFFPIIRLIVAVPNEELDVCYFKYLIDTLSFKGNGGAIPQLTIPMIRERIIPLPPLPLQQSFAEKIEAIERQKGLINRSIKEVQTLFDSRMDYYFGE